MQLKFMGKGRVDARGQGPGDSMEMGRLRTTVLKMGPGSSSPEELWEHRWVAM